MIENSFEDAISVVCRLNKAPPQLQSQLSMVARGREQGPEEIWGEGRGYDGNMACLSDPGLPLVVTRAGGVALDTRSHF